MPLLTRKRVRPTVPNESEFISTQSTVRPNSDDSPVSRESLENDEPSLSLSQQISSPANNTLNKSQPFSISNQINISNSQSKSNSDMPMSSKREQTFKVPGRSKKRKSAEQSQPELNEDEDAEMVPQNSNSTTSIEYAGPVTSEDLRQLEDLEHQNRNEQLSLANFECDTMFGEDIDNQFSESQFIESTKSQVNNFFRSVGVSEAEKALLNSGVVGHIQEITLHNFMCHTKFKMELIPRINFLNGPNGSGKSAILNAVVLGLGGRASNTNRGSGLASFIKTGESKARITIKLSNYSENQDKSDFYRPEKYGKSITVERNIYATGTGNYKIRDENGKVLSEKKDELDNILKHFSVLVDNPICVLTQEVSKNFLNTKSAADKFKFFFKATQLEQTKKDYETAYTIKEKALATIQEKTETIQVHVKELKAKEKQVRIVEILKDSLSRIQLLNLEALSANINQEEAEAVKMEKDVVDLNSRTMAQVAKIDQVKIKADELGNQKQEYADKLKNIASETEKVTADYEEAKKASRLVKSSLMEKESGLRIRKNELNSQIIEINHLKKRIAAIEAEDEAPIDIEAELENCRNEIEGKKTEEKKYQAELKVLQERNDSLIESKIRLNEEDRQNTFKISSCNSNIENITRGQKNRINLYGAKYGELMSHIDKAVKSGQFKKRPYGPIGEYIHLQDNSCALAVECCLKQMLFGFVVDNGQDSNLLNKIVSSVRGLKRPSIIIRKYGPMHNVENRQANSSKYPNFLQLCNIKEPEVANCLIDHFHLEQVIYIANDLESRQVMAHRNSVRNCTQAYNSRGDLLYPSTDRSDFKCYPNKFSQNARILVKDYSNSLDDLRRQIEHLNMVKSANQQKIQELNQEIDKNKTMVNKVGQDIKSFKSALFELDKKHRVLKSKSNVKPVEVMALRGEVDKLLAEKEVFDSEIAALTQERNVLVEQFKELETRVDDAFQAQKDAYNSRQPIRDKIDDLSREIANKNKIIESMTKINDDLMKKKTDYESRLDQHKSRIEISRQKALEAGDGQIVETTRTYIDIINDIKKIELVIRENQNFIDEAQQKEIIDSYIKLKKTVDDYNKNLNELKSYIDYLSESLEIRKVAYFKLRYYITMTVNYYFAEILSQKGFTGEIVVNFADSVDENGKLKRGQTLEHVIRPREEKQFFSQGGSQADVRTIYSNSKSLSGGERSYSTVAFIIALWEICSSPFKILDEVDVFMDMVTRKISIDTLIDFASFKSNKQYIFLSPLKIQHIERPECIKVFHMPEIERN